MGEIRKFEEAHIPEVAAMELKVFHGRARAAGPALQSYFEEIFFRNPWRDEALPSMVYIHGDKIVGFLGVIPRRMIFRGRPVRVAVATQFMVDTSAYRGGAGLELIRRFFAGPQDLSLTDGATEAAHAVWTAAGARAAQLYSLQWARVLRPARHLRGLLLSRPHTARVLRAAARVGAPVCTMTDAALSSLPFRAFAAPRTEFASHAADAKGLFECAMEVGWREPLKPCYDPASFGWLLAQAAEARRHGLLRTAVVRAPGGAPAGWYAYFAKRGGEATVLQFGAAGRHFEEVFQALLRDAWECGSTAVSGQAIPRFLLNLSNQRCVFRYSGNGVLAHSRDPELLGSILQGDAALSRLDGEWWTRFAVGDWD